MGLVPCGRFVDFVQYRGAVFPDEGIAPCRRRPGSTTSRPRSPRRDGTQRPNDGESKSMRYVTSGRSGRHAMKKWHALPGFTRSITAHWRRSGSAATAASNGPAPAIVGSGRWRSRSVMRSVILSAAKWRRAAASITGPASTREEEQAGGEQGERNNDDAVRKQGHSLALLVRIQQDHTPGRL